MNCPICGLDLEFESRGPFSALVCRQHGAWVDEGVPHLVETGADGLTDFFQTLLASIGKVAAPSTSPAGSLMCPHCGGPLSELTVRGIRVGQCRGHGAWFGRAALEETSSALQTTGAPVLSDTKGAEIEQKAPDVGKAENVPKPPARGERKARTRPQKGQAGRSVPKASSPRQTDEGAKQGKAPLKTAPPDKPAATAAAPAAGSAAAGETIINCLICGSPMRKWNVRGVVADVCGDHGVWLDTGELLRIVSEDRREAEGTSGGGTKAGIHGTRGGPRSGDLATFLEDLMAGRSSTAGNERDPPKAAKQREPKDTGPLQSKLSCPRCGRRMVVAKAWDSMVDMCTKHGVWLEKGKLEIIRSRERSKLLREKTRELEQTHRQERGRFTERTAAKTPLETLLRWLVD